MASGIKGVNETQRMRAVLALARREREFLPEHERACTVSMRTKIAGWLKVNGLKAQQVQKIKLNDDNELWAECMVLDDRGKPIVIGEGKNTRLKTFRQKLRLPVFEFIHSESLDKFDG